MGKLKKCLGRINIIQGLKKNIKEILKMNITKQLDLRNSLIFKVTIGLAFTLISLSSYGQDYYYFKPWKSKLQIPTENLIILIDSASTEKGTNFLTTVANKVKSDLEKEDIKCLIKYTMTTNDLSDLKSLILKFQLDKPAYVKLNTFEAELPLCNRINIIQTQPQTKRMINTVLSISVDKEDIGIPQFSSDISERLKKTMIMN
jgi:hypothetical protein